METSLHRQLKEHYARPGDRIEVALAGYRIDVVRGKLLVEIQHGSLSAIRDKVRRLLDQHRVLVVKPIVARKLLVQQDAKGGRVLRRRKSPLRGTLLDAFDELIYFTRVFPHPKLTLELLLVEIEEWRYPGHGRRRRWRKNDYQVEDRRLIEVTDRLRLSKASDLAKLLPPRLPEPFHTGDLADQLGVARWVAQRIAYCLRKMGAVDQVGKRGNTRLYRWPSRRSAA